MQTNIAEDYSSISRNGQSHEIIVKMFYLGDVVRASGVLLIVL